MNNELLKKDFLNTRELSLITGFSVQHLNKLRNDKYNRRKDGTRVDNYFPFIKIGRSIKYPTKEVISVLESFELQK